MTNNAMLDSLVVSNVCLSTTTKKQYTKIKSMREEINMLQASVNPGRGGGNTGSLLSKQEEDLSPQSRRGGILEDFDHLMDMGLAVATSGQPATSAMIAMSNRQQEPILRVQDQKSIGDGMLDFYDVGQL